VATATTNTFWEPGVTEILIDELGHLGDGVGRLDGKPLFVPLTLPGERVEVEVAGPRARLVRVVEASPDRIEPPCPHFGSCGGCGLQHLSAGAYAAFKRRLVADALADRGLEVPIAEPVMVPPASRRRVTFAGMLAGRRAIVGFNERQSHRLVAVEACPVIRHELLAARPAAEALTLLIAPRKGALDISATLTEAGLDVAVSGLPARDVERLRGPLIDIASRHDLARLAVAGEVMVERRPPVVLVDGVGVVPPPGGFLQASSEAEEAMAGLVAAAVGKARRVADLYAGVGTFALRLARTADVLAAEGEAGAVAALDRAARTLSGRHRIAIEKRDLARRPYVEKELEKIDAVVFDPPRTGAAEQSLWLARSKVPTVVAVSCNPATLARDLRTLVDGGYRIETVTPVDQFLWSSHVEVVAVLRR
jgi:23S rRNA (uracil1939-C5)-methyltransferase